MTNLAKAGIVSILLRMGTSALIMMLALSGAPADAQIRRQHLPEVGTEVSVSAGQAFYLERHVEPRKSIRLSKSIKSSMGGSMGLPFGFEITDVVLEPLAKSGDGWSYYAAAPGGFKAYHGLLGSVITAGDTVSIRVDEAGQLEWYVDNSIHTGTPTIWHRKWKKKDPEIIWVDAGEIVSNKYPRNRLTYLGIRDSQIRVRWDSFDPTFGAQSEDFLFPINTDRTATVGIRGGLFAFSVGQFESRIKVLKPMVSDWGAAVN